MCSPPVPQDASSPRPQGRGRGVQFRAPQWDTAVLPERAPQRHFGSQSELLKKNPGAGPSPATVTQLCPLRGRVSATPHGGAVTKAPDVQRPPHGSTRRSLWCQRPPGPLPSPAARARGAAPASPRGQTRRIPRRRGRTSAPAGSSAKRRTRMPSAVGRGVGHPRLKRCGQERVRQRRQWPLLQGPPSTRPQPRRPFPVATPGVPQSARARRSAQPARTCPGARHSPGVPEPTPQTPLPRPLLPQKNPRHQLGYFY